MNTAFSFGFLSLYHNNPEIEKQTEIRPNAFYIKDPSSNNWLLERTENYGYDANLDYLISADYNDGLANENPNWSYDASVVDNLNRATTIGGVSRTYDILGCGTSHLGS